MIVVTTEEEGSAAWPRHDPHYTSNFPGSGIKGEMLRHEGAEALKLKQ